MVLIHHMHQHSLLDFYVMTIKSLHYCFSSTRVLELSIFCLTSFIHICMCRCSAMKPALLDDHK